MLGAIIGDIAGSIYEFENVKTKDFSFLDELCAFTDDSVLTVAVAKAILLSQNDLTKLAENAKQCLWEFGRKYPYRGYGGSFYSWLKSTNPQPYNSLGNGSAMRVSPVGFFAQTEDEVRKFSLDVTAVTHNHPEGIKGAEAIAIAIFWARTGKNKAEIFDMLAERYYPEIKTSEFTYDNLVKNYSWDYGNGSVTCQNSVPQALACFNASTDFEDAIRTAISIGGDSDTIAAMVGGIAEAYYGIPEEIKQKALTFLSEEIIGIMDEFYQLIAKKLNILK